MKHIPITSTLILLGILGSIIGAYAYDSQLMSLLLFPIDFVTSINQPWRLITPAFLHFSLLHIVFNALWTWELGKRLELFLGKSLYLICFLTIGIGANYIQFSMSSSNLFGGLSGVVYGYLGMLLILSKLDKSDILSIPPGVYILMFVSLILGALKVLDYFIAGSIANGAHFGGLILGLSTASAIYAKMRFKVTRLGK